MVACGVVAAVIGLGSSGSPSAPPGTKFSTLVRAVPTNRVSGTGTAIVQVNGNLATVTVDTNGLLGAPHLMHIHGGTGNCPPPSAARPYRGHLAIGPHEGDKAYGPVSASLTDQGSTSPAVYLTSDLYPAVGNVRYHRTFRLEPGVASLIREGLAVIVVHGIDYNRNGRYDDVLGTSAPQSTTTVEQVAPALCGPLVPTQTAAAGQRSGSATYTVALRAYGGGAVREPSSIPLLCHIAAVPVKAPSTAAESRPSVTPA